MRLLTWNEVVKIHDLVCPETKGIRDVTTVSSLDKRAHLNKVTNFDFAKIIAKHHPFFDGNKRSALMIIWLDEYNYTNLDIMTKELIKEHKKEIDLLREV